MPNKLFANITEEDFVAMIIAADQEAFEFLYNKYNQAVYGILVNITNDSQLSEALLLECFVTIRYNIASFSTSESRLFTWILNQARNIALASVKVVGESEIYKEKNYVRENGVPPHSTKKSILELVMFEGYGYDELATIKGVTREEIGIIVRSEMNQMKRNFK